MDGWMDGVIRDMCEVRKVVQVILVCERYPA